MMEEILRLLKENNAMLKYLCLYVDKVSNPKHINAQDMKNLVTNIIANYSTYNTLERNGNTSN